MSFYSSGQMKSVILDPIYDRGLHRTEWRLDNTRYGYLPSIRLTNLGVITGAGNPHYNLLAGAKALIKRVSLMDGRTELCSQNNAQLWSAWKTFNNSNSNNMDMRRSLEGSDMGFCLEAEEGGGGTTPRLTSNPITQEESTTAKAWVDLRELLPLLASNGLTHLDTAVFKNLKIVIEWNNNINEVLTDNSNAMTMIQPDLVIDVIDDEDLVAKMTSQMSNSIVWMEIEHDSFIVPAIAHAVDVPINVKNYRLNGFNNKTLGRILLSKNLTNDALLIDTNDIVGVGNLGSLAQTNEKINFIVNGRSLLVGDGLDSENSKSAKLADSWGDCNLVAGGNMTDIQDSGNLVEFGVGQLDYIGCYVGEKISDLQVAYGREGISNGGGALIAHSQLVVNAFGEVAKSLTMKGSEYNVAYLN